MDSRRSRTSIDVIGIPGSNSKTDVFGNVLGYVIFAAGIWVVFDGYGLHASRGLLSDLAPAEIVLGLLFAVAGIALTRRKRLGLWILGAWVTFLLAVVAYDLISWMRSGTTTEIGIDWPSGYVTISTSVLFFIYFFVRRAQFRPIRPGRGRMEQNGTE